MRKDRRGPDVHGAIVVGVDRSRAAGQAVDWAADQAALEHRRLVLAHATGSLGTAGTTWLDSRDVATTPVLREMQDEGLGLVAAAAERLRQRYPDLDIDLLVEAEDAGPELRALAEDAHLVVVGSRGRGLMRNVATWQVGARVARRAPCPVVVVPRHDPVAVRRGVLVGADLTKRSAAVLRFGYELASTRELPLTVVHLAQDRHEQGLRDAERLLAESVAGLGEEFPDVHAQLRVKRGAPGTELLAMAGTMHVLVIGQHHALGNYESPIRHVHTSVVDRSLCPVAVVPQDVAPRAERAARSQAQPVPDTSG